MSVKRRFELVQHPDIDYCQCIRIRNGRYKGLVYHYGRVALPKLPDGRVKVEFHFTVVENPRGIATDEQQLHKLLGDILILLMDEELGRGEDTVQRLSIQELEEIYQKEVEADAGIDRGTDSSESDIQ